MIDLARYPAVLAAMPDALAARLSPHATLLRAKAGRTLIALGAVSSAVYLVLDGRVQVALAAMGGREVILRDLGPGTIFGEISAIDDQPRSASIVALSDCALASIPGPVFRDVACGDPDTALWLARRLSAQIRELTDKVFELNALRVATRLHCELLRLGVADPADPGRRIIDPAPTHAEFAARIGTHREAITRELSFLGTRGTIVQRRRHLTIVDAAALEEMVRLAGGRQDG